MFGKRYSAHKLHHVWRDIKNRCTNPRCKDYPHYGGRGITLYNEWFNNSLAFMHWGMENGWQEGLVIDRIDNDKGYSPDNCRFVTRAVSARNQRLLRKDNTSGYRGISFCKQTLKWVASVRGDKKRKYLGSFHTAALAAKARDKYVIKHNLGLPLNFQVKP